MNRDAVKSFVRCVHFLARQHITHTTNFEKLVELVISCSSEDLKDFLERAGRILCTRVHGCSWNMGGGVPTETSWSSFLLQHHGL